MRIRKFINKNNKIIVAFCLGIIISGSGVYAATAAASDVIYSPPSGSGLSSNVQDALDSLYNRASYSPNSSSICYTYTEANNSQGLCFSWNGHSKCFKKGSAFGELGSSCSELGGYLSTYQGQHFCMFYCVGYLYANSSDGKPSFSASPITSLSPGYPVTNQTTCDSYWSHITTWTRPTNGCSIS